MATQEQMTVSNPSLFSDGVSFTRVIEKGQKKQEKELAHLGAVLQLVEKEIAEAKSGAQTEITAKANGEKIVKLQTGNTNPNQGPSNNAFEQAMADMALALQMLQVLIAKYGNKKAKQQGKISNAEIKESIESLQNMNKQLEKLGKQKDHQKTASLWEKISESIIGAVTVAVGAVLCQPELIAMGVLSFAAAAGMFKYATNIVADILKSCGMGKEAANITAAIIVCVVVIAASIMACDPEAAGEEFGEASVEIGEDVADDAADDAVSAGENTATESDNFTQALKRFGKDVEDFFSRVKKGAQELGPQKRIAMMSTMTTLTNTELVQKIYDAIASSEGVSKKQREKVDQYIGIAMAIASMVVTFSMGLGAVSAAPREVNATMKMAKLAGTLQKSALIFGSLSELSAAGFMSYVTIEEGAIKKAMSKDQASFQLLNSLLESITTEMSDDQKQQAKVEKNQQVSDKSLTQLMKGIEGFANIAVYNSPV